MADLADDQNEIDSNNNNTSKISAPQVPSSGNKEKQREAKVSKFIMMLHIYS